jgi:3-oxoacyl-[acyl-carrier protein] reductase
MFKRLLAAFRDPAASAAPSSRVANGRLLDGRVALVTGGSGFLGSAIAQALAAAGARVAVSYHQGPDNAAQVVGAIAADGGTARAVQADITDALAVATMVRAVVEQLGPIDILVNNASVTDEAAARRPFLEQDWSEYQRFLDVVVRGAVNCCGAVLPSMVARRYGRIVNIGTTAVHELNAQQAPYVTAKAALLGLTRSLAEEFGPYNITVNQVVPGWIWPDDRPPPADHPSPLRQRSPLGAGLVQQSDVANAVVFFASDMARMITSASLPVCAGQIKQS